MRVIVGFSGLGLWHPGLRILRGKELQRMLPLKNNKILEQVLEAFKELDKAALFNKSSNMKDNKSEVGEKGSAANGNMPVWTEKVPKTYKKSFSAESTKL